MGNRSILYSFFLFGLCVQCGCTHAGVLDGLKKKAEEAKKKAEEGAKKAKEKAGKAAKDVRKKTEKVAKEAGKKASKKGKELQERVKKNARREGEKIKKNVRNAPQDAKASAKEAVDITKEVTRRVAGHKRRAEEEVGKVATKATMGVLEGAWKAGRDLKQLAKEYGERTGDSIERSYQRVEKLARDARDLGVSISEGKPMDEAIQAYLRQNVNNITDWVQTDQEVFLSELENAVGRLTGPLRRWLQSSFQTYKEAPLRDAQVVVRQDSNPIGPQERAFRAKRDAKTEAAQRALGIKKPYQISIAGSGGGLRATFGYLGSMQGLEHLGLLDTVTYASSLSGSTWMLSSWMQNNMSLSKFETFLLDRLTTPDGRRNILYRPNDHTVGDTVDTLVTRWLQNMRPNVVDIYGSVLGSYLLPQPNTQREYLSGQRKAIADAEKPMPLYTARWRRGAEEATEYVEFTPYEVGIRSLGFINSDGFGRTYREGVSQDKHVPYSVGYCQGLWGSAYAMNTRTIWANNVKSALPKVVKAMTNPIDRIFEDTHVGDMQSLPGARVPNFTYRLSGSPVKREETLQFMDAGTEWMGNPVFPLYRDNNGNKPPHALFVFDYATESTRGEPELRLLARHAKENGIPFPNINLDDPKTVERINKQPVSIFGEGNLEVPLVIYIPLLNINEDRYGTFKLAYSRDEARDLIETARDNVVQHKDTIMTALKKRGQEIADAEQES